MEEALTVSSPAGHVGRDAEVAVAAGAVRQLCEGQASALVIEGEAGIGKTRLVQSVVDDARSRDVAVFCGQAHPFERARPFGVVAAALALSRRSRDPRGAAIGALLAGQVAGMPAGAAGDIQYRVVEEIVELVETSCAERPVLLVAEDIHWADSASLLAISSVARQLPLAALLVVVTARPSSLSAEAVRLLDDLAAGGARTLQLQPLESDEVALLARQILGASPGPAMTAMLAKAGGNPLWAVAILRSLADGGMLRRAGDTVEPTIFELAASLSDLVVRRLRHLPRATLELLEVTAVLGDAVSLRDVAAVAGRPPAEVVGQLRDAFGRGQAAQQPSRRRAGRGRAPRHTGLAAPQARGGAAKVRHVPRTILRGAGPFSRQARTALAMDTIDMTFDPPRLDPSAAPLTGGRDSSAGGVCRALGERSQPSN